MTHRASNDAYSRRPGDDDRRGSDTYERRRGSYGRSVSDNYYRERERERDWDRDRDRERDRDRDRDRDRSRNRDRDTGWRGDIPSSPRVRDSSQERVPFVNAPRGPKALSLTSASSDLGVGRVRQDRHGSAGSSPMYPAAGMNIDNSNSAEAAISKIFRTWMEDISEYNRLLIPRENLDKAVKVRELEFTRSSQRPEFPSVPELHKKLLNRDKAQLKELDEKIKKYHHKANKTASQMGQLLVTALPHVEMKKSAQDADAVLQKGDLDAFRQEFQEMKSEFAKFRDTSTQENAALQEQVKDLKSQLLQSQTEKDTLQKTMKTMEVEHGKLRDTFVVEVADLQKQLSEGKSRQDKADESANEIAKLAACNAELLVKNAELQTQIGEIRTERSQLQKRLSDLEANFTRLGGAIETVQQESASIRIKIQGVQAQVQGQLQAGLELSSSNYQALHEKSEQQDMKLQQQSNTLAVVEQKLIHLDLEALDEISRNWTFDWDNMRKAVRKLQDDWNDVQKAVQVTQEDLARHQLHPSHNLEPKTSPTSLTAEERGQVSTSPTSIAEISRQVKDGIAPELNQAVTERIKKFTDGTIKMFNEIGDALDKTRKELGGLGARLQSIETSQPAMRLTALENGCEQIKVLEGKLEQVKHDLEGRIGQAKNDLEALKTDLTGKTDSMELQVSVLSTQFENLTTKELAEQIIGHMSQLTPSPHQLATDMAMLDTKVQDIQKQLRDISNGSFYKDAFTKELNGMEDTTKYVQAHKRRRVDSSANGVHQQPVS